MFWVQGTFVQAAISAASLGHGLGVQGLQPPSYECCAGMVAGARAVHSVLQRRQQQLLWAQILQGLELGAQVRQAVRELGFGVWGLG